MIISAPLTLRAAALEGRLPRVVTSAFHSARSRYVFGNALAGTSVVLRVHPAAIDRFDPDDWWRHRPTLRDGIFEWQKLVLYRLWY
jgi:uncharacterized SAM-binding protein YcdF (DUF218 family)